MARAVKDNQLLAGESVGYDGKSILPDETPKVNNYSFVPASPSPVPGELVCNILSSFVCVFCSSDT